MNRSTHEPIANKWKQIADIAKDEAGRLPPCKERDALLKRARQLEVAAHINERISSLTLKQPTR